MENEESRPINDIYFFWIDQLHRAKRQATARIFESINVKLTVDQWIILKRLSEVASINQKDLSEDTLKDPASMTRTLDILSKAGLVERRPSLGDRRSFQVSLTLEGTALVRSIIPRAIDSREKGLVGITKEELSTFRSVAERMIQNFNQI